MISEDSPYIRIGGDPTLHLLVERIHDLVENLPEMSNLNQRIEDSLEDSRATFNELLKVALGAPSTDQQIAPQPLPVPTSERQLNQWMFCLQQSLNDLNIAPDLHPIIFEGLTCCNLSRTAQVA